MNTKLINLIIAASMSSGMAYAAIPGPDSRLNLTHLCSNQSVNTLNAAGLATISNAMFDSRDILGTVDAIRNAVNPGCMDSELALLLAQAQVLSTTDTAEAIKTVKAWMASNLTHPHYADMQLLLADLALETGDPVYAEGYFTAIDFDALSPALRPDYLYHLAYTQIMLASYTEARDTLDNALLLASTQYGNAARFYLGYLDYIDHNYDSARKNWEKVNPNTVPGSMASYYLTQIAYVNGNYDEALRLARPLLSRKECDPVFLAEANRITGESLYQLGQTTECIPYLRKYLSVATEPELSVRYILGMAQYADGNYREAVENLTPVSAQDSAMGQSAFLYIGQALVKLGDNNGAIMAFNRALSMNHDNSVTEAAYYNYAVAKSRGANMPFASSVRTFEDFLAAFPDSRFADDVARYIVTGYLTDHNYDEALASINKVRHPSAAILEAKQKVLYALGARRMEDNDGANAIPLLQQAADMTYDPATAQEATLLLGEALYRNARYDEAAQTLLKYIRQTPATQSNLAVARYDLGYTRMAQKDWDAAATNFEHVAQHPAGLPVTAVADALARLGDARYYMRNWNGAAQAYGQAYDKNPASGDYPLFQKAVMQGYSRQYTDKLATLDALLEQFPQSALVPDALMEKAEAYTQLKDATQADNTYRQLIERFPATQQGRKAYLFLASDLASAGRVPEAIETYQQLISMAGTSDEARLADQAVKRLHAEQGTLDSYTEFIATVQDAPAMDAKEAETLTWNAAEHAYLDDKGAALLEKYLADYPSGSYASPALAYLLDDAIETDNKELAYRRATAIIESFPDNPAIEDALATKATQDYDQGHTTEALHTWETLEQKASTPEYRDNARLGIMRAARDLGDAHRMRQSADALLTSSVLGAEYKTEAAFSRGLAMSMDGETEGAITVWTELAAVPDDLYGAKAAVYAADALNALQRYDEAVKTADKFVNSGTPHTFWLARGFIALSDAYAGQKRDFEAREYLNALKENYPGTEAEIFDMIEERLENLSK